MDSETLIKRINGITDSYDIPEAQFALLESGESVTARLGTARTGTARTGTGKGDREVLPRFPFASVTKLFTATVAMQLVDDGDLELDAPLGQYGTEFADAPDAIGARVTLRHLLSHTGGLVCDHRGDSRSTRRHAAATAAQPLLFEPGSAFSYSNAGFVLVGRLIEQVTGTDWADAVSSFLLRPLGIEPSFVPGPGITGGHAPTRTGPLPVESALPAGLAPAAALAGTVEDLVLFARLHLDRRDGLHDALLDAQSVALMRTAAPGATPFGLAAGWGLGWGRYGTPERPWFGLDGSGAGTTCNLRVDPEGGTVIALLTNSSAGLAAWHEVTELLRADGLDLGAPPPRRATRGTGGLQGRTGAWTNGDTTYLVGTGRDGEVFLEDDDGARYRLEAAADDEFSAHRQDLAGLPLTGRFLVDRATGSTDLMQFSGRMLRRELNSAATHS
ncbi:serine hydrolase domain-containing protein [Streptomyces sp. NPDC021093]|uniref:serine hydrolase domain-containing protein n=1 Tax=Streptomyces sp. NPDC021093 TaxID=3365112 RepID=UPI00378AD411